MEYIFVVAIETPESEEHVARTQKRARVCNRRILYSFTGSQENISTLGGVLSQSPKRYLTALHKALVLGGAPAPPPASSSPTLPASQPASSLSLLKSGETQRSRGNPAKEGRPFISRPTAGEGVWSPHEPHLPRSQKPFALALTSQNCEAAA